MRAKTHKMRLARSLRWEGMPYKQTAARLAVSSSSAYIWTKDIELSPAQTHANLVRQGGPANPETVAARAAAWSAVNRDRRRAFQNQGRDRARAGESLHMAGCMLYWAEGSKERNTALLVNSESTSCASS